MNLRDVAIAVGRRWKVLSATVLLGFAVAAGGILVQPPTYESSAQIFVSTSAASNVSDLSLSATFTQQAVKSYAAIATSSFVLSSVKRSLGLPQAVRQLSQQVVAEALLDTSVVQITAFDRSPRTAADIANAVSRRLASAVPELSPIGRDAQVKLTLIEPASPPAVAASPNPAVYLLVGLATGLVGGIALCAVLEALDNKVRREADLAELTELPRIASIGYDHQIPTHPLAFGQEGLLRTAEEYRNLRANLRFVITDAPGDSYVISSSRPGEGKSTTAANLALALANTGHSVLLIDADLRRPRLHELFGIDGSVGLVDVLIGSVGLQGAVQRWGGGVLTILPAGTRPPNPSELVASERMGALLERARGDFDYVVADSPPLLAAADALVLAKYGANLLLIAASGRVKRVEFASAIEKAALAGIKPLGLVLTMTRRGRDVYGYYYTRDELPVREPTPQHSGLER